MKKIIVLIDNSVNSEFLAISAMNIALKIGADITFAHAAKKNRADDDPLEMDIEQLNEKKGLYAIADGIIEKVLNSTQTESVTKVDCLMHKGCIIELLVDETSDKAIDLVIIGSHQSGEWEKVMYRTQMQDILENIGCPLLIIPKKFIIKGIGHIIFAADLLIKYKKALQFVVAFSEAFGAHVLVNHISKLGFPQKPSEEDLFNEINLNLDPNFSAVAFRSIRSANVRTALLQTMENGNVDLLCLVHKNYNFLRRLFHKSMSNQLADNAMAPIMILQESY